MAKDSLLTCYIVIFLLLAMFTVYQPNDAALDDDWSMYQHDVAHTGYSSSATTGAPESLWNFSVNSGNLAVADGRVYFISNPHG